MTKENKKLEKKVQKKDKKSLNTMNNQEFLKYEKSRDKNYDKKLEENRKQVERLAKNKVNKKSNTAKKVGEKDEG